MGAPTRPEDRTAPLFARFSIDELLERLPYERATLKDLRARPERIRPRFRRTVARVLELPEDVLFGEYGIRKAEGDDDA